MTTRVFTVEVAGCKDCPKKAKKYLYCDFDGGLPYSKQREIYKQNKDAITESCPMHQHSFVKDEKK